MATKCPKCGGEIVQATPEIAKCKSCGASFKRKAPVLQNETDENVKKKKGGGCLKPILICVVVFIGLGVLVSMFGGESDDTQHDNSENKSVEERTDKSIETEYKIGESWIVDGQWSITVNSVQETDYRNQFEERNPAAVYMITYTYENLGYEDDMGLMEGLYFSFDDSIVDSTGKMGYSYPGDISMYPDETPIGASCEAQACIGVDNAGDFKIRISKYDGNGDKQKAVFHLEP